MRVTEESLPTSDSELLTLFACVPGISCTSGLMGLSGDTCLFPSVSVNSVGKENVARLMQFYCEVRQQN